MTIVPGASLFVDFRKWPDTSHWHFTVHWLGEDAHGTWYVLPGGSSVQRGTKPPQNHPRASIMLLQEDVWWIAFWNTDRDSPHELYCDIATPARVVDGRAEMIDLDLDVVRTWDGVVEIIDRDEFELHQKQLGYPADVIRNADRAAELLAQRIERREEPFARVGEAWLARGTSGS